MQGLSLLALVGTLGSGLGAFLLIRGDSSMVRSLFVGELELISLAVGSLGIALFLSPNRTSFWAFLLLRGLLIAAFVITAVNGDRFLHIIVIAPLIFELAVYERVLVAAVVNGLLIAGYAITLQLTGRTPVLGSSIVSVAILVFLGVVSVLVKHYREQLVRQSRQLLNLEGAFEQLTDSNLGLQLYATNAGNESAHKERSRITRELHDAVGYALTNIGMMLKASRILLHKDTAQLDTMLQEAQRLAADALQETRRTLYRLRTVDDRSYQGLWAISRLVKAYRLATGVDVEVNYGNVEWSLGREIDAVFYRVVQEGLTNAYRHGGATRVRITMWVSNDEVALSIWDNGVGAPVVHDGIGLKGMKERLEEQGGTLVAGNVSDGFELTVRLAWTRREPTARSTGEPSAGAS